MLDKTLRELLVEMDDPRREALIAVYDDHQDLFNTAFGSGHNHQAWEGGYADHIAECIRVNRLLYPAMNQFRELPFTMGQATFCLFFHDIEKPFRYGPEGHRMADEWRGIQSRSGQDWEDIKWWILNDLSNRYGFTYADETNAIKYTHGEGHDHKKDRRVAGPLAAHVHHCDNISARIWHDEGKDLG